MTKVLARLLVMAFFLGSSCVWADPATIFMACMKCHPKETSNYLASSMGQSISVPGRSIPSGKVVHSQSGASIAVAWRNGKMIHHLSELGLTAEYGIQYQIGAGKVGHSYVSDLGGRLLESPASYYRNFGWDVSPGYEGSELLDFNRVVGDRCLFCHSDRVRSSEETVMPGETVRAIGCTRCHGPTEEHLRNPVAGSIINPAKLPVKARDSVCEQCHLEGVARVLNPGKALGDFRPGSELEGTLAIYVLKGEGLSHVAVSQAEQLAVSRCSIASQGKLWCGSCHDPHAGKGVVRSAEVKAICSGCHAKLSVASHPAAVAECTSCHMPRLKPRDVAHAATTDHRILARSLAERTSLAAATKRAQAWREPPVEDSRRDLALAEIAAAGSSGYEELGARGAQDLIEIDPQILQNDAAALAALGSVRLSQNDPGRAVELFVRASQIDPSNSSLAFDLGIAAKQKGDVEVAIRSLRRSFELNPSLERAYLELAAVYTSTGKLDEAREVLDECLKWNKQSILVRVTRDSLGGALKLDSKSQ